MPSSATRDYRIWSSATYWAQDFHGVKGRKWAEEDWGMEERVWILGKFESFRLTFTSYACSL